MAVGYGIIVWLIAPVGTFLPLIVLYPARLWTRQVSVVISGTLLIVIGFVFCALAGRCREREVQAVASSRPGSGYVVSLVMCFLSGVSSPMLNFSFVFGEELKQQALFWGAQPSLAVNSIWSLALTAGSLANIRYSA